MALSILDATSSERGLELFFAVSREVYRGDRYYCAPAPGTVLASLNREDFQGLQRTLVALENGEPVARLVARRSPTLRDARDRPYGVIGFFEALDRPEAVERLFKTAIAWLRDSGVGPIVGPLDGDTWHSYRLNVGPYDERPFLLEPYNPSYYPSLWERSGFRVLAGYSSKRVDDVVGVLPHLESKYREVLGAGYRLERLRIDRFEEELRRFCALSCKVFRDNFLYNEIRQERFIELYSGVRQLLDPDLVCFAIAPDGTDAGFLFAFPDRFQAVAAMHGRRGPVALFRFLVLQNRVDTVNLKSLGVVRAHRRSGLGSALMYWGYKTAHEKGYRKVNLCLIQDNNPSGGLDGGLGTVLRRYHLYQLGKDRSG
jgi:GNAT superfamily N-acetyltransferase